MTVSALDEMAPGRIVLGLGSALPLRLAQMGIPYEPASAVEKIGAAVDTILTLVGAAGAFWYALRAAGVPMPALIASHVAWDLWTFLVAPTQQSQTPFRAGASVQP